MAQFMPKLHASNAGRATKCLKRVNAVYISKQSYKPDKNTIEAVTGKNTVEAAPSSSSVRSADVAVTRQQMIESMAHVEECFWL